MPKKQRRGQEAHPRRLVHLDAESLKWALACMNDDKFNVARRSGITPEWEAKYNLAATHLQSLIEAAERT